MSEGNIKEGISVGLQIRKLFKVSEYDAVLEQEEKGEIGVHKIVVNNFLANKEEAN